MNTTQHLVHTGETLHFITFARLDRPELYVAIPEAGTAVHITSRDHVLAITQAGDAECLAGIAQTFIFTSPGADRAELEKPAQLAKVLGTEPEPLDLSVVKDGWIQACYTTATVQGDVYLTKYEDAIALVPANTVEEDDIPHTLH
jgi:hypothetical protein